MTSCSIPSAAEVAELSGSELDLALVELETQRRELEAATLAVLDRADVTGRHRHDGHASVRGWVIALTNASPVETRRRLQTMRAVRDLPEVGDALADGHIGVDQVREIAKLHAVPTLKPLVTAGAGRLVQHATGRDFVSFGEVLHRWSQFGDPRRDERRHAEAHDRRRATMFERDGAVHLAASCGSLQGAALMEAFERQADAEFLADFDTAKATAADVGDDDPMKYLPRTESQRRMDALSGLIERGVSAPPGSVAPEPLVDIVMTQDQFEATLVEMAGGAPVERAGVDDVDDMRCETTTGIGVSARDAVIAAMIGHVRRVVIDSAGRVIDLGRKRRFTGAARHAVLVDGRRCLWPGCGRTSHRNQIDHTHEHARGGTTTPHNGGPACGRHNRLKSQGYTAYRDAAGTWHVLRPDGTELTEPAA